MKILEAFLVSTPTHLAKPSPNHSLSPCLGLPPSLIPNQHYWPAPPSKLYQVLRMKYFLKNTAHLVHTFKLCRRDSSGLLIRQPLTWLREFKSLTLRTRNIKPLLNSWGFCFASPTLLVAPQSNAN